MSAEGKQQTILVVGASRGVGLGLVKELASRGVIVLATTRCGQSPEVIDGAVFWLPLDLRKPESVDALVAAPQIDTITDFIVVAGVMPKNIEEAPKDEDVSEVFLTNAVAPILFAEKVINRIQREPDQVVFLGSVMGSITANNKGDAWIYRASKAALLSAAKSLFARRPGSRTKFSVLHPGWVRTDMGGADADIDVETSARGLADHLTGDAASPGFVFQDYNGNELVP